MTANSRALGHPRSRAERARDRRARLLSGGEAVESEALRKIPRRRKARPRRRFDFALPAQIGAQVQLPALPVLRFGPRLLSSTLLLAVLVALQQAFASPSFQVAEASVSGSRILSETQVRMIVGVGSRPVFLVDPRAAEKALEEHPEVVSAKVRVRWPNEVWVDLVERHPMVEWDDAGRVWWICPDGIAYLKHGEWPGLVAISSAEKALTISEDPLKPVTSSTVLRAAAVLNAQMPQEAASLTFDKVHGLGFKAAGGWMAYFGVDGDMVMKVRTYKAIVASLESSRSPVAVISVEDVAAPYVSSKR